MKREPYSLGFIIDKARNFVLLQESAHSWMNKKWNGIGGHIEENESPLQAMQREATEEINMVKGSYWQHRITYLCPGGTVFIFAHFSSSITRNVIPNILPKQKEAQDIRMFDIDILPKYRMQNISWMIPLCLEELEFPTIVTSKSLGL